MELSASDMLELNNRMSWFEAMFQKPCESVDCLIMNKYNLHIILAAVSDFDITVFTYSFSVFIPIRCIKCPENHRRKKSHDYQYRWKKSF